MKKHSSDVQRVTIQLAAALFVLAGAVGVASQSPYTSIQGRDISLASATVSITDPC